MSIDKILMVANMGWWDGDLWRWRWRWRRNLFSWEEELMDLFTDTMKGAFIFRELVDEWIWKVGNDKVYTVKLAYTT